MTIKTLWQQNATRALQMPFRPGTLKLVLIAYLLATVCSTRAFRA